MGQTLKSSRAPHIVVVGAGIGGLACALRLAHAGCAVTVVESRSGLGGKMRTTPSVAGPVDAGPTVLALRAVFDALFAEVGEALDAHMTLTRLPILARHYWDDGASLDLMENRDDSAANITSAFGPRSAQEFLAFSARAQRLFDAFDGPMMRAPSPSFAQLVWTIARWPGRLRDMAPHRSLAGLVGSSFSEPKLAQLFARYATYVGGSPLQSPALLALIADAEARGVWAVTGGMHRLAQVIAELAQRRGARFVYSTPVEEIVTRDGRVTGVYAGARLIAADAVVFNGDPRALHLGLAGQALRHAVPEQSVAPRSLSAWVLSGAAQVTGPPLAYHTLFFGRDSGSEFAALAAGQRPQDATLYVCAQDRATGNGPGGAERLEIILNGAPAAGHPGTDKDRAACQTEIMARLAVFGLKLEHAPEQMTLTTPQDFAVMFPGSQGSLYGRSPHGITAGLKRPTARTRIQGLYLVGGGAHPGAGVPMATLSARHAAAAIATDLVLPSSSRPAAMHGGMSMA